MFALRRWTNGLPRGLRMKSTWASAGSRSSSWRMAVHAVARGRNARRGAPSVARVLAKKKAVPWCSCFSGPRRGPARAAPYQEASP